MMYESMAQLAGIVLPLIVGFMPSLKSRQNAPISFIGIWFVGQHFPSNCGLFIPQDFGGTCSHFLLVREKSFTCAEAGISMI